MSPTTSPLSAAILPPAINSGLAAISAGNQRLNQDAEQIAAGGEELTQPLVDLSPSKFLAEAGAAVIRTSNSMLGTLLDAFA
jgi:hypothetical protein